jgi:hypothetical protein
LAEITLAIEKGLSAQRIYQDLVTSHAFAGKRHPEHHYRGVR